jgi:hypothetical protein
VTAAKALRMYFISEPRELSRPAPENALRRMKFRLFEHRQKQAFFAHRLRSSPKKWRRRQNPRRHSFTSDGYYQPR